MYSQIIFRVGISAHENIIKPLPISAPVKNIPTTKSNKIESKTARQENPKWLELRKQVKKKPKFKSEFTNHNHNHNHQKTLKCKQKLN